MTQIQRSLAEWLIFAEQRHPQAIDLGLERVTEVAARMGLLQPSARVVIVGGTNGKGSCVAVMEQLLLAEGVRVGAYTSPHLRRYNERIRVLGAPVSDALLCAAFVAVEAHRGDTSLTYFEIGTLVALQVFRDAGLDVQLLEVGLGGRLDAVNIIDADVAVVTSIDLDHTDWLGPDRESIGYEKAGIFRRDRPAVCADRDPPLSLRGHAERLGAHWFGIGTQFDCAVEHDGSWYWRGVDNSGAPLQKEGLPRPDFVAENVAAALQALALLGRQAPPAVLKSVLMRVSLPGRYQRVDHAGIECRLDVAHNPAGMRVLAARLRTTPLRTVAVFGAMADKDIGSMLQPLAELVECWFLPELLGVPRAASAAGIAQSLPGRPVVRCADVASAMQNAWGALRPGERLLVCGSFYTVAPALDWLDSFTEIGK